MNKNIQIIIAIVAVLFVGGAMYYYQSLDEMTVDIVDSNYSFSTEGDTASTTTPYVPAESDIYPAWYPFITTVTPSSASRGAIVTLTGGNWNKNARVYIGGVKAGIEITPLTISTTTLTFKVPMDAMLGKNGVEVMLLEKYTPSSKGADLIITN